MSPSWCERFEIVLRTEEVVVRQVSRGWRPREQVLRVRTAGSDVVPSLQGVVAGGSRRQFPAIADLILTEPFCRHALIPWAPNVRTKNERAALLRACFEDLYGDPSAWRYTSDNGCYGEPRPAFAAEDKLLTDIRSALAASRIQLRSITPFFAAVFNKFRLRFREAPGVLAVVDSGWASLATFYNGSWNSFRSTRIVEDGEVTGQAIAREAVLQGLPDDAALMACSLTDIGSAAARIDALTPWDAVAQPFPSAAFLPGRWLK